MTRRLRSGPAARLLAFGILLRPLLVLPMAPGGLLAGSELLPVATLSVVAGHAGLAAWVLLDGRLALAAAVVTSLAGVPLAVAGALAGLEAPWPWLVAAWNALLVALGIAAWRALPAASDT